MTRERLSVEMPMAEFLDWADMYGREDEARERAPATTP